MDFFTTAARTLACVLLVLLSGACERASEPDGETELHLAYPSEQLSGGYGDVEHNACWLTGPHETLVVAELVDTPVRHSTWCPPEPYLTSYYQSDLELVRISGLGLSVGDRLPVKWFFPMYDVQRVPEPGDFVVASLRKAGTEWMILQFLPVSVSSTAIDPQPGQGSVELPDTWSGLQAEAQDIRANFETRCTEKFERGVDEVKAMSDSEFDTWIHTPSDVADCSAAGETDAGHDAGDPPPRTDDSKMP